MNRHESRVLAMRGIFIADFNKMSELSLKNILYAFDPYAFDTEEELEQATKEIENDEFSQSLIKGVISKTDEIDEFIKQHLENYTLDRLSYVDRAIIRLATYELLFTNTPSQIVINEAIEITKEFSNLDDGNQTRFNNRLLDMMARSCNERR